MTERRISVKEGVSKREESWMMVRVGLVGGDFQIRLSYYIRLSLLSITNDVVDTRNSHV